MRKINFIFTSDIETGAFGRRRAENWIRKIKGFAARTVFKDR